MTITSPILAIVAFPLALVTFGLVRGFPRLSRWLVRTAALAAAAAIAGVTLQCDRPPNIAVVVDVSPSTRGATFRDPPSVKARLTPLLAGRPYTLHYFADGPQPTADESPCERTRLVVPADADAVVLLSDGRLARPANLPPTYPVIDPALDASADARVTDLRDAEGPGPARHLAVDVVGDGVRPLKLLGARPAQTPSARGPAVLTAEATGGPVVATFDAGDRWPENDRLAIGPPGGVAARWSAGVAATGFVPVPLPTDAAAYTDVAAVVVSTQADVTPAQAAALTSFVKDLGGTLVLNGPPAAAPAALCDLSPLDARPPAGPQRWIVLLDASGSMAAPSSPGHTRWDDTRSAAGAALDRLPPTARVDVLAFAGDVRTVAAGVSPADARQLLAGDTTIPSGPTGLRSAVVTLAARPVSATRVLLLTDGDADLGDVQSLTADLRRANITLDAVTATPAGPLRELCRATGGESVPGATPAAWAAALGGLAGWADGLPGPPGIAEGRGTLAGRSYPFGQAWPAFLKTNATAYADASVGPVIAGQQRGLGRVIAVAATTDASTLAGVATAFERLASDPRFTVRWDVAAETVRLFATDAGVPMNGLRPVLRRGDGTMPFTQTAPGQYTAAMRRSMVSTTVVVTIADTVVARKTLAGHYPAEFDAVGNDRAALAALAAATGGAVIEPGDARPIEFAVHRVSRSLRPVLATTSAVLLLAAVHVIRFRP